MKKSFAGFFVALAMLCAATLARDSGVIAQATRKVYLSEPDITLFSSLLRFRPGQENRLANGKIVFEYVVAVDYADTLIAMEAITQDTKEKLSITAVDGPLNYASLQLSGYNQTDFLWF